MLDIHTHILPNVDDGSKSLEISIKLIEEEIKNGVDTIILTPHQNKMTLNKELLTQKYYEFMSNINFNINIYLGAEIYYYDELRKDLLDNKVLTMNNSKYVLIEFSTRNEMNIKELLYDIKISGFKPIIAHIERYPYLSLNDIKELHNEGYLIQVNTKSFNYRSNKKLLKFMAKNDLIDFISTDCHDLEERNVDYKGCIKFLKKYPLIYDKLINNKFKFE